MIILSPVFIYVSFTYFDTIQYFDQRTSHFVMFRYTSDFGAFTFYTSTVGKDILLVSSCLL